MAETIAGGQRLAQLFCTNRVAALFVASGAIAPAAATTSVLSALGVRAYGITRRMKTLAKTKL
jgi:hypothetical protein